jgi:SAM-dependent methyltransferase
VNGEVNGDVYIHGHHESVLRSHQWRTAENSAAYLLPFLAPGARLLDIGCGPGTITVDLAERVAPGTVVGIDRAEDVLAVARASAAERGLHNVTFAVGDAYRLQFPDDSVDVVHAHQVLQHLTDPVAALTEMRRVGRPGGVVAVRDADYAATTWYPADPRLDRWLELLGLVGRASGAEPDAGRRLLSWAHAAGLHDVSASASVWCFADDVDRRWWGGLWADRMTESDLAEQAVAAGLSDRAELRDIAQGWRDWSGHPRRLVRDRAWRDPLPGPVVPLSAPRDPS